MNPSTPFDRFVTAVHRRAVIVGWIERVGVCLGAAAGAACVLVPIAGWRGAAAGPIVGMLGATAVIVGSAWGAIARPTRLTAVMQADQQLRLADLLSTALLTPADDFGRAVHALAERACERHSPSEVVLNRFGARAWGGLSLAWAMVLVLSLLAGRGSDSRADQSAPVRSSSLGQFTPPTNSLATGQPAVGGHEAASDDFSHLGSPQDWTTAGTTAAKNNASQPGNTGGGERSAKTDQTHVDATHPGGTSASPPATDPNAVTASGSGSNRTTPLAPGQATGDVTASPTDRVTAPWSSDHWPADRAAALQSLHDGLVPDAYRELVRDYFDTAR